MLAKFTCLVLRISLTVNSYKCHNFTAANWKKSCVRLIPVEGNSLIKETEILEANKNIRLRSLGIPNIRLTIDPVSVESVWIP